MKLFAKLLFLILITGCEPSPKMGKYHLELVEENPYVLNIKDFSWEKQNGSNMPVGEFDAINKEVMQLLKGKTGICEVYMNPRSSEISNDSYIGFIMLSKDKDWNVFFNRGGVRSMLEQKLNYQNTQSQAEADSTVVVDSTQLIDTAIVTNP